MVILAGLTPVLALWQAVRELDQVLPAAVAAAIIGLRGWQENRVRFAATVEALKDEMVKFQTHTGEAYKIGEDAVPDNFVARI